MSNNKHRGLIVAYNGLGNSGVPNLILQVVKSLCDFLKLYSYFLAPNGMPNESKKCIPSAYSSIITSFGEGPLLDQNLKQRVSLANSPISTISAKSLLSIVVSYVMP